MRFIGTPLELREKMVRSVRYFLFEGSHLSPMEGARAARGLLNWDGSARRLLRY